MAKMKKRSLRGLGGTTAKHKASMESWTSTAKAAFNNSAATLGAGECRNALYWLFAAQEDLGHAGAHAAEAGKITVAQSLLPVRKLGTDVRRLFEAKCLHAGAVAPLGRRPTRRKARR